MKTIFSQPICLSTLFAIAITAGVCAASWGASAAKTIDTLWSMDVERQTPYNIEMVSAKTEGDYKTDQFYISSAPVAGRDPDRVLCTYSRVVKPGVKSPGYLSLTGGSSPGEVRWLAEHLQCAVVDLEWRNLSLPVRSKWSNHNKNDINTVTPAVTDSFAYAYAMAARRVIDYLSEQPEIDKSRIGVGGGSMGGWFSLLISGVDNRVNCAFDVYGCGNQGERHGCISAGAAKLPPDQRDLWVSSYDPSTFAQHSKAATVMFMGANDFYFWLGDGIRQYDLLGGDKRIVILPNFNHNLGTIGYKSPDLGAAWVMSANGIDTAFPTMTDPVASGDTYSFKASGPVPISSALLYWSPGPENSPQWPSRYWLQFDAKLDGGVWKAAVPNPYAKLSGLLFATVFDSKGRAVSSHVVGRTGADPASGSAAWKDGALWDIERGAGAWRVPGSGNRSFYSAATAESAGVDGLKITPAADGKFGLVTDSAGLSCPLSSKHKGIRLVVDGNGQTGHLRVSLDRSAGSLDEISFVNQFDYAAGVATIDIPWSQFQTADDKPGPAPFDALRIEGARTGQSPLVLQSIAFYD